MITSIKYLTYVLKTDIDSVEKIINNLDDYYISWDKPKLDKDTNQPILKKDGSPKVRSLNSTKAQLKLIQKRIYKFLLSKTDLPEYLYGGVTGKDNVLNAKQHQGNKYIFTTDLKGYFPSISHNQVFQLFLELGCTPQVSRILTQLTTYKYQVPQGVPTSTLLANLIFIKTGNEILEFTNKHNIKFTIFVDDLTFSSKVDFKSNTSDILKILTKNGYKISYQKTFYKTKNPIITGVVCQNNKLKLPNSFNKRLKKIQKLNNEFPEDINCKNKYRGLSLYKMKIRKINQKD